MSVFAASSSTPAGGKAIAASALRSAGLIDRDAQMRDVTDNPGGRKGRIRSGRTTRTVDLNKSNKTTTTDVRMHSIRSSRGSHAGPSDPLSRSSRIDRTRKTVPGASTSASAPSRIPVLHRQPNPLREGWTEFVNKRYNPDTKYLDLGSMVEDPIIKKYNLTPPGYGGSSREASVIFRLASKLIPEVQTLSLANNNLSGEHLLPLNRFLPNLVNLSLHKNNIRDRKDLFGISSNKGKLAHLQELILTENPIREKACAAGKEEAYRSEVSRLFPSLQALDMRAINQISFDAPQGAAVSLPVEAPNATTFPFGISPTFITGVDGALISEFLVRFFNTFDTQRDALESVYDTTSTFSFSVNTTIPTRARQAGLHTSQALPNQRKLTWGPWLGNGSRNLSRVGVSAQQLVEDLRVGPQQIVELVKKLPGTRHNITGPPEKFCLDAFPVSRDQFTGLLVTLHGEFIEVGAEGVRSFDRSFMLVPAPDNSRAKLNGWNVVILSDQWIIRGYSSPDSWKPGPLLVQAVDQKAPSNSHPIMPSLPPDQQAALATLPEPQRNLVMQVCAQTNLNVKFAVDCLTGNGWDLAKAIANFNDVKGNLARDAFL
ncbi:hypothetical protein CVT24_004633 [Panaeolus cyanescens]|uniref:NTF2-like protein n=1 Tax=Panaeolus cyanescens TaxID=181874 RepID=A0A409YSM0_9AGAR|nr:hypothetical protein CVT24_004633 [Panaeolus cyanescens]